VDKKQTIQQKHEELATIFVLLLMELVDANQANDGIG
jgi:hypothetical protein